MSARILVVDDIEANRRLLQAKLEAQYHQVLLAASGREAMELARREQPDIILLDIMMPGLDGYDTCRGLKANPRTSHIPVVMVTALSDVEDRIRGLEAGAEDFITKPVKDFALFSRIEALSRYNTVANELRQRQARGVASGAFDETESQHLSRPIRVLVMDENASSAGRVAGILRQAGHQAVTLLEADGMPELGTTGVDLMVLNLAAESYDALRVCAAFRAASRTRAVAIIAASDAHDEARAGQALQLGASDVITMPIIPQELIARVRTQVRRTRYLDIMRRRVDRGLELSVIDQLTGLHNRRYMMHHLRKWMKRAVTGGRPVSVVALDIDHFKKVNDNWGHAAGDAVLQEVAHRLRANVRPLDIVCRPGGEEFVLIMPETDGVLACTVAERVRDAVASEPFIIPDLPVALDITLSAGVATINGSQDTASDILGRADAALYEAKSSGRNQVRSVAA